MWTITVTLFILSLITWLIYTRKKHHPPLPPGPPGLPIVGSLFSLDPELHSYFTALSRSYGPIVSLRLGTKRGVVVSSPALAREVLKEKDSIFANRDPPSAGLTATYGGEDVVWKPYGPEWRTLRKVCVRELLGPATLDAMYGLRRREVRREIKLLKGRVGSPVMIGEEMFLVAMNIMAGMLWGGTVAETEERDSIGKEFRRVVAELVVLLGFPNVSDFFPAVAKWDLQGVEKRMSVVAKEFDGIFERVIDQRLKMDREGNEGKKKRDGDFLQVLLQMKDEYADDDGNNEAKFSMVKLKGLFVDLVVGGTDTTSNTTEFAMAELLKNPEVLRKVQQELDTVVGKDSIVEEHHIDKLSYLQAVMKETLRMHPVIPLLVPHSPSETCVVGGYTVPKGSQVFLNAWAIHRDPSSWPDPLEFKPERFLNAKTDFYGHDFRYFPFGSGRRICVGIGLAERMVLFTLASLFHSFDWRLPEGEALNLEEKFGIVLTMKKPLALIPEPRLINPLLYE